MAGPSPSIPTSSPAILELGEQGFGDDLGRAVENDRVIRSGRRPAGFQQAFHHFDLWRELTQHAAREGGQILVLFQRHHRAREPRQQGGRIPGAATDIEHVIGRGDVGSLQQPRQYHRLEQAAGAVRGQRKIAIEIREGGLRRGDKPFARHLEHGRQQVRVENVACEDLAIDHHATRHRKIHDRNPSLVP